LDLTDPLNLGVPFAGLTKGCGQECVDRHNCVSLHINDDDLPDIACFTGAAQGIGHGFPEIYLTQPDGTLYKERGMHGLQKITTISSRELTLVHSERYNSTMIFVASSGKPRNDNQTNTNQMFLHKKTKMPYFKPLKKGSPWRTHYYRSKGVITADYNRDGRDDIIQTHDELGAVVYLQRRGGGFKMKPIPIDATGIVTSIAIADVTGDGISDIIVSKRYRLGRGPEAEVLIYQGNPNGEGYLFDTPYYRLEQIEGVVKDVEVLDVNDDGIADIYVVIMGMTDYCKSFPAKIREDYYRGERTPPEGFVPPVDEGKDILLRGTGNSSDPFERIDMDHAFPGCGEKAEKFGDNKTLVLLQSSQGQYGYTLLLKW